jgi:glycine C-acetyltransferase
LLRNLLQGCGLEVYGDPSAIVCVKMGTEPLARLVSRRLPAMGMLANLVEFPAVPKGQARFRLQVMANHSQHDILDAVHRLSTAAVDGAEEELALLEGRTTLATLDQDFPLPNMERKTSAAIEKLSPASVAVDQLADKKPRSIAA